MCHKCVTMLNRLLHLLIIFKPSWNIMAIYFKDEKKLIFFFVVYPKILMKVLRQFTMFMYLSDVYWFYNNVEKIVVKSIAHIFECMYACTCKDPSLIKNKHFIYDQGKLKGIKEVLVKL